MLCCVLYVVLQVNHLGPYTLTRMLEPKLIASKARVVNVVSVTHRIDKIRCGMQGQLADGVQGPAVLRPGSSSRWPTRMRALHLHVL